jgi:hypothetical protein
VTATELTHDDAAIAVVLGATDTLVGHLADAVPALQAVGDTLESLAGELGVARVIVAIDDAELGRQVFCSGRRPLGDGGVGLFGPEGTWTEPARTVDAIAAQLLERAIVVAVGRAGVVRARPEPAAAPPEPEVAISAAPEVEAEEAEPETDLPDTAPDATPGEALATVADAAITPPMSLGGAVAAATARALRHGWGFTLVLLRGGPGLTEALRPRVRAADTFVATSDRELALLLPETAGDRIPDVLARLAAGANVPAFSYGLACCPADSRDAAVLARIAAERLADALRAHALG